MERPVRVRKRGLFGPSHFTSNQIRNVRQTEALVQRRQVGLDLAGAHQVDAGQEDSVHVEEWLHSARLFLAEELPLGRRESEVVVRMVAGDDTANELLQFFMFGATANDKWRCELFKNVAVAAQEQAEELADVMGNQVELEIRALLGDFDGAGPFAQTDHSLGRQHVNTAHVEV